MITIFKQIGFILATILILGASGGISLYHHYCSCDKSNESSVFFEMDDNCHQDETQCCNTKAVEKSTGYCSFDNEGSHEDSDNNCNTDCCSTDYVFYSVDSYKISSLTKKSFKFLQAYCVILNHSEIFELNTGHSSITYYTDLPPPEFGRDLLISFHQLKIDFS